MFEEFNSTSRLLTLVLHESHLNKISHLIMNVCLCLLCRPRRSWPRSPTCRRWDSHTSCSGLYHRKMEPWLKCSFIGIICWNNKRCTNSRERNNRTTRCSAELTAEKQLEHLSLLVKVSVFLKTTHHLLLNLSVCSCWVFRGSAVWTISQLVHTESCVSLKYTHTHTHTHTHFETPRNTT